MLEEKTTPFRRRKAFPNRRRRDREVSRARAHSVTKLLSQIGRHPKTDKNMKIGVMTWILHLAPARGAGIEVCPFRSKGCTAACLNTAGFKRKGRGDKQAARVKRTRFMFKDMEGFFWMLEREIHNAEQFAQARGMQCGIRLNGTSDIKFERLGFHGSDGFWYANIMSRFPDVKFMDYTKDPARGNLPPNYRLVFSRSEDNGRACLEALRNGLNVAVVFSPYVPVVWSNMKVIDGDAHDWRYGDYDEHPQRVIVGLKAKGRAINDNSGFTIQLNPRYSA